MLGQDQSSFVEDFKSVVRGVEGGYLHRMVALIQLQLKLEYETLD